MHSETSKQQGRTNQGRDAQPEAVLALERRIARWARWAWWQWPCYGLLLLVAVLVVRAINSDSENGIFSLYIVAMFAFAVSSFLGEHLEKLRLDFIRNAPLPPFLSDTLIQSHPQLTPADAEQVLRGLREFFAAYLHGGRDYVAMPSQVVDTAWHAFILDTQAYEKWCATAFGRLLHHHPAQAQTPEQKIMEGLKRSWAGACEEENIDATEATRLPLLFALDARFDIENGFRYAGAGESEAQPGTYSPVPLLKEKNNNSCGGGG
jgi:hypothetical protein